MANSVDEYKKKYYTDTAASYNTSVKAAANTRDKSNAIAKEEFDANDAAITESYNTGVAEAKEGYQTQREQNAVQKLVNERQLAERMANLGLIDSGLNRTQQTAVQLSYSNKLRDINITQQKAIDSLAATMRGYKTDNQLTYNKAKAENDLTFENTVAKLDADRADAAHTYAVNAHNADVEAENDRIKAQNEASEKQAAAKTALIDIITKKDETGSSYYSDDDIKKYIRNYISQYGGGTDFLQSIGYEGIAYEGWGPYEWREYFENMRDQGVSIGVIRNEITRLNSEGLLRGQNFVAASSVITTTK